MDESQTEFSSDRVDAITDETAKKLFAAISNEEEFKYATELEALTRDLHEVDFSINKLLFIKNEITQKIWEIKTKPVLKVYLDKYYKDIEWHGEGTALSQFYIRYIHTTEVNPLGLMAENFLYDTVARQMAFFMETVPVEKIIGKLQEITKDEFEAKRVEYIGRIGLAQL